MKRGHLSILVISSIILALFIIPLISALSYYSNPLDYLNNEWTKFGIIFVLLFAAMYSFFNKRMQSPGVSAIIAAGLSALISIPIMQRGLIDNFLSPDIVDWAVIIAFGIMFIFLFYKFGMRVDDYGRRRFSIMRLLVFLGLLVILLYIAGDKLPDTIMFGPVGEWIDIIKSLSWWVIVIALAIILSPYIWKLIKWLLSHMGKGGGQSSGSSSGVMRGNGEGI